MDGGGGGIRSTSAATTTEAIAAIAEHTRGEREREQEGRERAEVKKIWVGRASLPPSHACVLRCCDGGTSRRTWVSLAAHFGHQSLSTLFSRSAAATLSITLKKTITLGYSMQ